MDEQLCESCEFKSNCDISDEFPEQFPEQCPYRLLSETFMENLLETQRADVDLLEEDFELYDEEELERLLNSDEIASLLEIEILDEDE